MIRPTDPSDALLDAALLALAEEGLDFSMAALAVRIGRPIAELYDVFPNRLEVLAAITRRADRRMLAGLEPYGSSETARERLFDVVMRRFDALADAKPALRRLRRDPQALFAGAALAPLVATSAAWMIEAAGLSTRGPRGLVGVLRFTALYGSVARVWLTDDSVDLGLTMKALDQRLERAESWLPPALDSDQSSVIAERADGQ